MRFRGVNYAIKYWILMELNILSVEHYLDIIEIYTKVLVINNALLYFIFIKEIIQDY